MNIWLDSLAVLRDQIWPILGSLAVIFWGQTLITKVFKKISHNDLTNAEYLSLGMAGWIIPVALGGLVLFGGIVLFGQVGAGVIAAILILVFLFSIVTEKPPRDSLTAYLLLIFFLVSSIILHLAFLRKVILPLYFDSAQHYQIIKSFFSYYALSDAGFPLLQFERYYHVGYHFLSAAFSYWSKSSIVDTMLVQGQIMIAILPVSLFFVVRRETKSDIAGMFTSLLAGFGWNMPGYAVNWGKYPALYSLIGIHFVLCVLYLVCRDNISSSERYKLYLLLGLGVLVSGSTHTRSLVIFAFLVLSTLIAIWWKHLPMRIKYLALAFVTGMLVLETIYIQASDVLEPLFGDYLHNNLFLTCLIAFLMIFALKVFTDLAFISLVMLLLLLSGLFISLNGLIPGYGNLVLLDRPYVQLLLYLPISILGGLGLAGFQQFLQKSHRISKSLRYVTLATIFGAVMANTFSNYDFYPSDCCQIVRRDDLAAFEWIDKMLPHDANILVASTGLYVTSIDEPESQVGVDGGAWITPLTARNVTYMSRGLDFAQPETHREICERNLSHIYVGAPPLGFNNALLTEHPEWYQVVLALPEAKVYEVIGCR